MNDPGRFRLDEEALREVLRKTYHEKRQSEDESDQRLLEAARQLLSGRFAEFGSPLYHFEDHPTAVDEFYVDLESISPGLAAAISAPLLQAIDAATPPGPSPDEPPFIEIAPNLSVWLASLAGPIALRHSLDEPTVAAVLAAALLSFAKLGTRTVLPRIPSS